MKTNNVLTIAGSDILSGGGLQADFAVINKYGAFSFLAQTCLTTIFDNQFKIYPTNADLFREQIKSFDGITFSAIKIGLLPEIALIRETKEFIIKQDQVPIVLDPVLIFKENQDNRISDFKKELISLFPYCSLITPNLKEAEILSDMKIIDKESMKVAAKKLFDLGAKTVVIKGGNRFNHKKAIDLFYDGSLFTFIEKDILNHNNNGAGCTFATAIALYLAEGLSNLDAVSKAKDIVYQAIIDSNEFGVRII